MISIIVYAPFDKSVSESPFLDIRTSISCIR